MTDIKKMDVKLKPHQLFLFLIIICWLPCCTSTGLSIASTGAQALTNHNKIRKFLTDNSITRQANRQIYSDTYRYRDTHVAVTTVNQEVLLTGEVPDPVRRDEIGEIVKNIDGVKKVYNLTTISTPSSYLSRASDSWLTTKIKAKLLAKNNIENDTIKVVSENGTVFLLGTVFAEQANTAVQIARTTDGVQSVVKIFYYLHISRTA